MYEAQKTRQSTLEVREEAAPESAIRDIRVQLDTPDPAYDFYDELTEPLWNPPLLVSDSIASDGSVSPPLNSASPVEAPSFEELPILTIWQWLWMTLSGG